MRERKGCGYLVQKVIGRFKPRGEEKRSELYRVPIGRGQNTEEAIAKLTLERGGIIFGGVDPKTGEIFVTSEHSQDEIHDTI